MNKLNEYKIAFRNLKEGVHFFEFKLDSVFFDCFDTTKGTVANIDAKITLQKSSLLMEIKIELNGVVKAECDRCLSDLDLDINGELQLYVKQSEREEGNDDDYIIVHSNDDYIELGSYLYETYMLNYPIRVLHKDGECDEDMQETLAEYMIEEEEERPTDPRWDELKKLINN